MRYLALVVAGVAAFVTVRPLAAQSPNPGTTVSPTVRAAIQRTAGPSYPLLELTLQKGKAAHLVFEDTALSKAVIDAGTWMCGPSVTTSEADGCPPEMKSRDERQHRSPGT